MSRWSLVVGLFLSAWVSASHGESKTVTVVELFTSQGCYSCPPADKLLGELDNQGDVIALSCHVTYWNYLGWKDSFSRKFCDNRQRAYQQSLLGNRGVYTPQMVVNGVFGAVGSRKSTVQRAMGILQKDKPVPALALSADSEGKLAIELPEVEAKGRLQLLLLGTSGSHTLSIPRGENGGKTLDYHNPVEYEQVIGAWDGKAKTVFFELDQTPSIKEWVVLAQRLPVGEIVAAGSLE